MHLSSLKRALTSEMSFALQRQQTMLELPLGDRIAAGISWPLFRLSEHSRQRQQLWLRLQKHGRGLLHDGIERGDLVRVSPATSTSGFDGRIIDVHNNGIEVNLLHFPRDTEPPRWLERGDLAITKIVDTSTYESYQRALSTAQAIDVGRRRRRCRRRRDAARAAARSRAARSADARAAATCRWRSFA